MQDANRVAFNTAVQYVRLILNVLLGLITVRVVLDALGETDYGVYNLLAGVIAFLSFIQTSLSQTSVRFLSVSLGKGEKEEIRKTFSSCFWVHIIIAVSIGLILLLAGLFLFKGFLNIPPERLSAAKFVYYCMIVTLFLNITITPFDAIIVAHEKFVYTAFIATLDAVLKLFVALAIARTSMDKLVMYGVLMTSITVVNVLLYLAYTLTRYRRLISICPKDRSDTRSISGFAGWTLFDILGSMLNRQGYAVVLNKFFGPSMNATYAVSGQVEGNLYNLSASLINAMKPQIMKSKGAGDDERMMRLSMTAGKFGFSMMALISIPLIVLMPEVMDIWLKQVPEGAVLFSRVMVLACMFEQLTKGLVYANQANGNIKWFSIIVSSIRALAFPVSIIALLLGAPAKMTIVIFLIFETLGSFSRIIVMSRIANLDVRYFVEKVLIKVLVPFAVSFALCYLGKELFSGWWSLIAAFLFSVISFSAIFYFFGLTNQESTSLRSVLSGLLNHSGSRQ